MRGSPVAGAPTSSSSGTWCTRARGSSSSSVGRRCPDPSRDRVLTEMPVVAESPASVASRSSRSARSRGPTPARTSPSAFFFAISATILAMFSSRGRQSTAGIGTRNGADVDEQYDVVVVGGGTAGLSGALALSRARRSVLVVDDGTPRNAPAGHVHNYLGREAATPAELLASGRAEIAGYGGRFRDGRVVGAEPTGG